MAGARRLTAIMFTDLVGFTAAAQENEDAALALLRETEEVVRPVVRRHGGREVKSTGDGMLAEFPSAIEATECALEIQDRLRERNRSSGGGQIALRVGLHVGEVEDRAGDIFGDAVNLASRIVAVADPGGVCLSASVFDLVRRRYPDSLERLGPRSVKGVREPIEIYRVVPRTPSGGPRPEGQTPSRIAVLPLANISPDPGDEYLADGLTEELIAVLSRIRGLRTIARTSVLPYKATPKSIGQIGSELNVRSILEGSVRKSGNRLRITLQLIDASTQERTWSETYDRTLDDVFAIQTDIAERTASALRLELQPAEHTSLRRSSTTDLGAYELYLRGLHAWHRAEAGAHEEGLRLLEEAIRRDPEFSLAHSTLAHALLQSVGETLPGRVAFPRIREHVTRALAIDPESSDAHAAAGSLALHADLDWARGESELRVALELNPSNSIAHGWYGVLLEALQRFPEAIQHYRAAINLDPFWPVLRIRLAATYLRAGAIDESIEIARNSIAEMPGRPDFHRSLAAAYWEAGRTADAESEAKLGAKSGPEEESDPIEALFARIPDALIQARLGHPEPVRRLLEEFEESAQSRYVPPHMLAALHAIVGNTEVALEILERDQREGDRSLWFSYQLRAFDGIRDHPRFVALLRAMRLPETILPRRFARETDPG